MPLPVVVNATYLPSRDTAAAPTLPLLVIR